MVEKVRADLSPPSNQPYNLANPDQKDWSQFREMAAFTKKVKILLGRELIRKLTADLDSPSSCLASFYVNSKQWS